MARRRLLEEDVLAVAKDPDQVIDIRTGRVLAQSIRALGEDHLHALGPQLWASVFLHDLARTHDGVCHRHGADAAQRLRGGPDLQQRLAEAGLTEADYPAIEAAVTAHSAPKEVSRAHPYWPTAGLG